MKVRLYGYWDRIRSSLWFLPAVMAVTAVLLSLAVVAVDRRMEDRWPARWGWLYTGGSEGASAVLESIAGSMVTIAGVVFSLTLVALTLASSQFGPRLLRNFMTDKTTQVVLGTFIASFLYSLLVLRTIRREDEDPFVPHLGVTIGVLLAVLSMGVLIWFIHHVAVSIQADELVARIGRELDEAIDRLYPEEEVAPSRPSEAPPPSPDTSRHQAARALAGIPVPARDNGYLQFVDQSALLRIATEHDLLIRLEARPGHYVVAGRPIGYVSPATGTGGRPADDSIRDDVTEALVIGSQRTQAQDIEFQFSQLVEVAVRALSPGINDPFTAVRCVDHLGSALYKLAGRRMAPAALYDDAGAPRLEVPAHTYASLLQAVFDPVRQSGCDSAPVAIRMLEMLAIIAEAAVRPEDREAMRDHAHRIADAATRSLPDRGDQADVGERLAAFERGLAHPAN